MATFKVFISYLVFLYMPIKLSTPLSTVKFKECFFYSFRQKFSAFLEIGANWHIINAAMLWTNCL